MYVCIKMAPVLLSYKFNRTFAFKVQVKISCLLSFAIFKIEHGTQIPASICTHVPVYLWFIVNKLCATGD